MKQLHLDALRDIAIEYIPKARNMHSSTGRSHDAVSISLYTLAFLTLGRPTASAVEMAAAQLLQHLMALRVPLDEKLTHRQRKNFESYAVSAAHDLFEITERQAPAWLPPALTEKPEPDEEIQPPAAQPPQVTTPQHLRPAPGINLTTAHAAQLLNRKPQTLRSWASKDNGPIRPVGGKAKNGWPSDDVLRLMKDGW